MGGYPGQGQRDYGLRLPFQAGEGGGGGPTHPPPGEGGFKLRGGHLSNPPPARLGGGVETLGGADPPIHPPPARLWGGVKSWGGRPTHPPPGVGGDLKEKPARTAPKLPACCEQAHPGRSVVTGPRSQASVGGGGTKPRGHFSTHSSTRVGGGIGLPRVGWNWQQWNHDGHPPPPPRACLTTRQTPRNSPIHGHPKRGWGEGGIG